MIYYKASRESDPYIELWSREEWKRPVENASSMKFPLIVTVEPTNACQNKCLYCSRQLMDRKIGFMSLDTMDAIARECGVHRAAIRHGGFGEPLLHPKIVELCASCKRHGVLTTIFSNCNLLTEDMMKAFIDMGLDEIRFSSSGVTPEEHNAIRKNSNYSQDFDQKIRMAHRIKESMGAEKPFFTLYTNVVDYNDESFKDSLEAYKDKYLGLVDKIDIDLTMFSRVKDLEHVKELYKRQTVVEKHKSCVTLFLKLIVHWNGDVFACDRAYDYEPQYYLGTLGKNSFSLEEGYKSSRMEELRRNMSFAMNHDKFPLCKDCYTNTTKWEHLKRK